MPYFQKCYWKILSLALMSFVGINGLFSQGKIVLNEPSEVSSMMSRFIQKNRENTKVKAWQIQIISTDDRRRMESVRAAFQRKYPELKTSWKHVSPFYQVRAGAFRTKTQLMPKLLEIRQEFPLAAPVMEDIEKSELLNY
jgi:light-regulated signal transduction histidine kinase (bacteriophytochrome)